MAEQYYTYGSIETVSINDQNLRFKIKPINGFEANIDDIIYVILVKGVPGKSANAPKQCVLLDVSIFHDVDKSSCYAFALPVWILKKDVLQICFEEENGFNVKSIKHINDK